MSEDLPLVQFLPYKAYNVGDFWFDTYGIWNKVFCI